MFLVAHLRQLDDEEVDLLALEVDSHANVVRAFDGSFFEAQGAASAGAGQTHAVRKFRVAP